VRASDLVVFVLVSALSVDCAMAATSPGAQCEDPPDFSQLLNSGWSGSQENKRFATSAVDQSNVHLL
jgi:hypothetical protein